MTSAGVSPSELLDSWPALHPVVWVGGKEASVTVTPSDQWLCVARLPLDMTGGYSTVQCSTVQYSTVQYSTAWPPATT